MGKKNKKTPNFSNQKLNKVREWAKQGLTILQVGAIFGLSKETMYKIMERQPELETAWKEGRAKAAKTVTGKLWQMIESGDRSAIYFYLKTQCHWRETARVENVNTMANDFKVEIYLPKNGRETDNGKKDN